MPGNQRGFTLTELMIVVAIVVILGAVALPNFTRQVMRAHRTDAKSALLRLAAEQEKFYLQNNSYGDMADLGNPTTDSGWYTLAVPTADATTFTITATATSGGPQAEDTECVRFSINAAGQRAAVDSSDGDSTATCW
jgi:type IV pilus assembly protein PilE